MGIAREASYDITVLLRWLTIALGLGLYVGPARTGLLRRHWGGDSIESQWRRRGSDRIEAVTVLQ